MTAEEIFALTPSELDAEVSKVLSATVTRHGLEFSHMVPAPPYSTDIAAAWKVYLHVMDHLFPVRRRFYAELQEMTREKAGGNTVAWPDVLTVLRGEMPTAICRAALMALTREA